MILHLKLRLGTAIQPTPARLKSLRRRHPSLPRRTLKDFWERTGSKAVLLNGTEMLAFRHAFDTITCLPADSMRILEPGEQHEWRPIGVHTLLWWHAILISNIIHRI